MTMTMASYKVAENTPSADSRRQSEMELFSERFGSNYRTLRSLTNELHERLDRFAPQPSDIKNAGKLNAPEAAEPPPGTLASLSHFASAQNEELARLNSLLRRLEEIF